MILSRRSVLGLAAACALTGCSGGSTADRPTVVATTSIWADITSQVLCGEDVTALIPAGADPHTFEPSLRDRETLDGAELIVANGSALEGSVVDLLAASDGAEVVEMTDHVDALITDGAGHPDPHVWQDPSRVAGALDAIASAAIGRSDCSDDYAAELLDLDAEITAMLGDVPVAQRVMVTSHDSLEYFADRYDLEIVGTVIPSTNTLAATNAADLAELADVIENRGVDAIFTDALESTADADSLARRLGVDVVPLVTDALTDDPASDTYVEMMRSNATLIAEALTP